MTISLDRVDGRILNKSFMLYLQSHSKFPTLIRHEPRARSGAPHRPLTPDSTKKKPLIRLNAKSRSENKCRDVESQEGYDVECEKGEDGEKEKFGTDEEGEGVVAEI